MHDIEKQGKHMTTEVNFLSLSWVKRAKKSKNLDVTCNRKTTSHNQPTNDVTCVSFIIPMV